MRSIARNVALLAVVALAAGCKDDRAEARESLARARQLAAWHRDRDAEAALREAARLDPRLYEARMRLARIALDAGRFGEAKTQAASVLRDVPRAPYPLELLGRAELGLGHLEPALDALTKSRDADPTRVRLGFEIGRIDEQLGRHDDALAAYRAVVHADAHALDARVALAHAMMPDSVGLVLILLAEARPLAAPGSPQAAEIDGLDAWCVRLLPPRPSVRSVDARMQADEARRQVDQMLLGALGGSGGGLTDVLRGGTIVGPSGLGYGSGLTEDTGVGVVGDGLGIRGYGGGGGRGEGTIGLGGLGTIGHSGEGVSAGIGGPGIGGGGAIGGLARHNPPPPPATPPPPEPPPPASH